MIQRWDIDGRPIIRRFDDGEYVKVADHEAIVKELVEALDQARQYIEDDETAHGRKFGTGNAVRAAIAKARGNPDVRRTDAD